MKEICGHASWELPYPSLLGGKIMFLFHVLTNILPSLELHIFVSSVATKLRHLIKSY